MDTVEISQSSERPSGQHAADPRGFFLVLYIHILNFVWSFVFSGMQLKALSQTGVIHESLRISFLCYLQDQGQTLNCCGVIAFTISIMVVLLRTANIGAVQREADSR